MRERREDIVPLARTFLGQEGKPELVFTAAAKSALERHPWPGNVRELANAVKHGVALASANVVDVEHLPEELTQFGGATALAVSPSTASAPSAASVALPSLAEVERQHVLRVLEACGGSQMDAARVLKIGRSTLWRKMRQYD